MINLFSITLNFGAKTIFNNLNLNFKSNDKVGLIGRNGAGKSTLLKIIVGHISPTNGKIIMPKDYKIGYLPQEMKITYKKSIKTEVYESLTEIYNLSIKLNKLTNELNQRKDYDSNEYMDKIQEISELNTQLKILGGNSIDAEIEKVLTGLGFKTNELERPLNEFSGGWQMRVEIAKILLNKPHCILLDEPTNHLDIESISWLEEYLKNYKGLVIIVSHDISFLDNITSRTIEIIKGKVIDFDLPYSKFIEQSEQIRKQQKNAYENQQRQIAQTQKFIERFRYKATLASRVQSKEKMLEKMEKIEIVEVDNSSIKFKFPPAPRSSKVVIETINLTKYFGNNLVLENINFAIERGEKIAFVGKNGEGKTTLSKIFAKDIQDFDGELKFGNNVSIGYYAQHQAEQLDPNLTVFETIDKVATGEIRTQIRNLLGAFLFNGNDVFKKVKVLSGGEKSRLALAQLLLKQTNLLILDEPTNHLDITAKQVLKHALMEYQGAVIVVSHDRNFLKDLTTKTVYFKDHKIKEYYGDIFEFIEKQKIESLKELEKNIKPLSQFEKNKSVLQLEREEKKKILKEKNKLQKLIDQTENDIQKLENKINEIEQLFTSPDYYNKPELHKEKNKEYNELKEMLTKKYEQWEELNSEIDKF